VGYSTGQAQCVVCLRYTVSTMTESGCYIDRPISWRRRLVVVDALVENGVRNTETPYVIYEDLPSPETIVSTGMKDVCEMLAKGVGARGRFEVANKSLGYASIRTVQKGSDDHDHGPITDISGGIRKKYSKS